MTSEDRRTVESVARPKAVAAEGSIISTGIRLIQSECCGPARRERPTTGPPPASAAIGAKCLFRSSGLSERTKLSKCAL